MPNTLFLGDGESKPAAPPDVVADAELAHRPWRAPDYGAECAAYVALVRMFTSSANGLLQKVADTAMQLCRAQAAGVSLLEDAGDQPIFRWHAASGSFAGNIWRTVARDETPCGAVVDENRPLLMVLPDRRYPALRVLRPRIREQLLVPLYSYGAIVGTLWVLSQRERVRFDSEHMRLLTRLAEFAAVGYEVQMLVRLNRPP
jgi:GAF domain-containing protein